MTPGTVMLGHLSPGVVSVCFAESLIDLMFYDAAHTGRLQHRYGKLHKECGADGIYAGRNRLAQVMLDESTAEWLFFIDSDMGFAPDTVDRLIASADPETHPVVGGLAFAMKSDGTGPMFARRYRATPTVYRLFEDETEVGFVPMFDYPRDEVVPVGATGAACLLIHRSALEAVRDSFGDRWFNHLEKPKGDGHFGEDMAFCIRLAACDVAIHVDTAVKTTHDKGGVFFDEDTFDVQQSILGVSGAR